jgi:serine beta-lactamase-like protein LACTB
MNSFVNRLLLFFIVLLSLSSHANNVEEIATQLFDEAVSSPSVPGINVAVADTTGIIWAKGFGLANIELNVPMTAATKMRIGSVAKVITTAALMRLYEKGLIDFDRDVRHYVLEWPKKHKNINLAQLTNHTSGIRHYKKNEFFNNRHYESSVKALNIFKQDELLFNPGSKYSYSTYAWTLVSAVMESATGDKTFKNIIHEHVLKPLKLKETTFDDSNTIIANRQSSYVFSKGELLNTPEVSTSYKYAGGGFLATPSDVVKFAMAHTNQQYLNLFTLKKMFTKHELPDGSNNSFGIGWRIGFEHYINSAEKKKKQDTELIELMQKHSNSVMHSGSSMGSKTMMILCLDHNHSVTVVKNVSREKSVNVFNLALKTLDLFTPVAPVM